MIISIALLACTVIVLICGLLLMARGGNLNKKYSNKLMIMRVVFQGLAICSIGIIYYLKHTGNI